MTDQETPRISDDGIPGSASRSEEPRSFLQDTAISHCEKLRRVLELEEWIKGTGGVSALASACRRWQEERAQLLAELDL
jgi:hypothetical protein